MKHSSEYVKRRLQLIKRIRENSPELSGAVVLPAGFEAEHHRFRQESSFYYLTGINEPAGVLVLHLDGRQVLYVPNFGVERHKWVKVAIDIDSDAAAFGLNEIKHLSKKALGYSYSPFFRTSRYQHLLDDLHTVIANDGNLFTLADVNNQEYFHQFHLLSALQEELGITDKKVHSIADIVYKMRRIKGAHEENLLRKAIDITAEAQHAAAQHIRHGVGEWQVQAAIEQVFTTHQASHVSFPSIVATGKNSTVLHYIDNHETITQGDLVVVDIGAEFGHYAADLTRTYPAGGVFSDRQKEIYQLVLDAQEYAAARAKPGMFLRNASAGEQSLHGLVVEYFKQHGYAQYFPHGLGHYQGLDVHDVGNYLEPLEVGDVFTIEPGLYIPEESLGVRIEDNYIMRKDGAECLSEELGKTIEEIEELMLSE